MTRTVKSVGPETSLTEILSLFEANTFHHIPVVNGGKVLGIISKLDFYRVSHLLSVGWDGEPKVRSKDQREFRAADVMTPHPVQLQPDDTIGLAADIVLANRFHALPVVSDDRLVGILTAHDLLEYAYAEPGQLDFAAMENQVA